MVLPPISSIVYSCFSAVNWSELGSPTLWNVANHHLHGWAEGMPNRGVLATNSCWAWWICQWLLYWSPFGGLRSIETRRGWLMKAVPSLSGAGKVVGVDCSGVSWRSSVSKKNGPRLSPSFWRRRAWPTQWLCPPIGRKGWKKAAVAQESGAVPYTPYETILNCCFCWGSPPCSNIVRKFPTICQQTPAVFLCRPSRNGIGLREWSSNLMIFMFHGAQQLVFQGPNIWEVIGSTWTPC